MVVLQPVPRMRSEVYRETYVCVCLFLLDVFIKRIQFYNIENVALKSIIIISIYTFKSTVLYNLYNDKYDGLWKRIF